MLFMDCEVVDGIIIIEVRGGIGLYGYSIDGGIIWVGIKVF